MNSSNTPNWSQGLGFNMAAVTGKIVDFILGKIEIVGSAEITERARREELRKMLTDSADLRKLFLEEINKEQKNQRYLRRQRYILEELEKVEILIAKQRAKYPHLDIAGMFEKDSRPIGKFSLTGKAPKVRSYNRKRKLIYVFGNRY